MLWKRIAQIPQYLSKAKTYFKWRFASLEIRVKMIIITGVLVVGMLFILSFTFFQSGQRMLRKSLAQTCDLSLRHVSQVIKDDLMMYYDPGLDQNARSEHEGYIRQGIFNVMKESIDGLDYACVIDRDGIIVAHTDINLISKKVTTADSLYFSGLKGKDVRESADIIEHVHPVYARRVDGEPVYLGVTALGFSKKAIMGPIQRTTETMISATLIIAIISIILVFFVAHRMTRQIEELGKGVRRISDGNLKHDIAVLSNDELGQLAREFNQMLKHLNEKLYMQKFVSKYTVKMIRDRYANGMPLEGESRNVTLLFSDVRNFSMLTDRMPPKEIVKLINIYLDLQSTIIETNLGVVDKFMGDQVMAIFEGKDQVDNAIKSAVEIQRAIGQLNEKRRKLGVTTLTVGIGVDVGSAVLGNMGSKNRMDYTVIGDVVNLAARLCALAKPGQIIAPIEIAQKLHRSYSTRQLEPVLVKGRSKPVTTLEVEYEETVQ